MQKKDNQHIALIITLSLAGFFVFLPCFAQSQTDLLKNQNLNYWSGYDQLIRIQNSRLIPDFNFLFQSKVVCDSSLNPVRDCHIINTTQRTATVTDAFGDFKISAGINDSITFSALGYEKLTITLTGSMFSYGYIVKLKPIAYDISEVTITPFSLNFPSVSRFEIYTPPLPNQGGVNLLPAPVSPVTALYNRFSKEGRQRRYYKSVLDGNADFMLIGEKFNGSMVAQITGLKDDELIAFMSFCKFSNDFLLNYSPETISRAIKRKYAEFVEQ